MEVMTVLVGISTMMITGSTAFITHGPATIDPRELRLLFYKAVFLLKDLNIWFIAATVFPFTGTILQTPGFPGRCYDVVLDMAFFPGEFWQRTKECVEYFCGNIHLNGAIALHTSVNWCSKMHVQSPCKVMPGNFTLQFPECCPTVKCSKVHKVNLTHLSTARKTWVTTQDNTTKLVVLRENGNVASESKE